MKKSNPVLFVAFLIFTVSLLNASPTGWRNDVKVTFYEDNQKYGHCSVTTDAAGRIHVALRKLMSYEPRCYDLDYYRSTDTGISWSYEETTIGETGSVDYRSTDIAVRGDSIMISYELNHDYSRIYFARLVNEGDSVVEDAIVSMALGKHPRIAVDGSYLHIIHAREREAGNYEIYHSYSTNLGSTWSDDVPVTNAIRNSWHPAMSVNDTTTHIAWADNRSDVENYEIYYNKSSDHCSTWVHDSIGFPLTYVDGVSEFPDIVAHCDPTYDAVHVVWQDDRTTKPGPGIYYRRSTNNGSSWENAILLCADGHHPAIAADSRGLYVVFEKNSNIYYLESTNWGNTWQETLRITDTPHSDSFPDICVDDLGRHVVYCRTDTSGATHPKIWYKQRDINAPSLPYITDFEKSGSDAVLTWNKVATDVLGNSEAMDYYVVHRDTAPSFVPSSTDSIGAVLPPETTYIDSSVLDSTESFYYLVMAVDEAKNKSKKSNMGFVFHKFLNENHSGTPDTIGDRNWVSLPWQSEYATCSLLCADLSPNAEVFNKVTHLVDTTQAQFSYFWHPSLGQWKGINFATIPGHFYEFNAVQDTTLVLVGANFPDSSRFLNENPGASDRNWVGLPYNAAYSTVSDITDEIALSGSPINKVTHLVDSTQMYFNYFYHPSLGRWLGTNFAIEPGHGYEFVATKDSTWNPTEWSNKEGGLSIVTPPTQKPYINMYVGTSSEPTRVPVWFIDRSSDKKVEKKLKKDMNHCCADLYRPVIATLKSTIDHRKDNIYILDSETYTGDGAGEPRDSLEDERRISHLEWTHLHAVGFENIVFTTYRLKDPHDVLTEKSVGSVFASNAGASYHLINYDVGNFKNPWKHGEEVVFIIEATKEGKVYYDVIGYKLDDKVDIQVLRDVEFKAYSTLVSGAGGLYWNAIDSDNIVGYSLYQNGTRLNERVLTQRHYRAEADVNVKLVIKGGYETVYGSQGIQSSPEESIPISFAFNVSPNPFVKQTRVNYALTNQTSVKIVIYDVSGRKIKTLASETQSPGYYSTTWNGIDDMARKVAAGVYFIRLDADGFKTQDKVLMVK